MICRSEVKHSHEKTGHDRHSHENLDNVVYRLRDANIKTDIRDDDDVGRERWGHKGGNLFT